MESKTFVFAGMTFKLTPNGHIRRPAMVKVLRSGKVRAITQYENSSDFGFDAVYHSSEGAERDPLQLAKQIEKNGNDWTIWKDRNGKLVVTAKSGRVAVEIREISGGSSDSEAQAVALS